MTTTMTLDEYAAAIDAEFQKQWGISWADAWGGTDRLRQPHEDGEEPADFVRWFGEKYDLIPKSEW